ncbi:Uncharacterized protein Fot_28943 [Forsythia ovata]|uniref:Uncharacterized protein n=1 Tax=Forsythia ovata TaxID=205694 RepID=A0ABD1TQJ7_9LAMI
MRILLEHVDRLERPQNIPLQNNGCYSIIAKVTGRFSFSNMLKYIYEKKIKEMSNPFDTKVARHNMASGVLLHTSGREHLAHWRHLITSYDNRSFHLVGKISPHHQWTITLAHWCIGEQNS